MLVHLLITFFVIWFLNAVGVMLTGQLVPGVRVKDMPAAAMAALALGIFHVVGWKLLVFLTLPLTILTLGLFYFFLIGFAFWVIGQMVPGFEVDGIFAGLMGSFILGIIMGGMGLLLHHPIRWW